MNSRVIFKRNFTISSYNLYGCFNAQGFNIKQVFCFNCVRINKVPLYHSEDEEDKYYLALLIYCICCRGVDGKSPETKSAWK